MNRSEEARKGYVAPHNPTEEAEYHNKGLSCPCLLVAAQSTKWKTLVRLAMHAGFAKVSANHEDYFYQALNQLWFSSKTSTNTTFIKGRSEICQKDIDFRLISDHPEVYEKGVAWTCLSAFMDDANLHVMVCAGDSWVTESITRFREWMDILDRKFRVVYLVSDPIDIATLKIFQESKEIEDGWLMDHQLSQDWKKTLLELRPPCYPKDHLIHEAI